MLNLWIAIMLEYMFQYESRVDAFHGETYDREEWAKRAALWIYGFTFGVLGPVD